MCNYKVILLCLLCIAISAQSAKPKKVAILGGGIGGLATAYFLTSEELNSTYEVRVYQIGWRLGGKASTGRNADYGNRIEEKGIHMLFGFYEKVFNMLAKVYEELNRNDSHPLSSLDKALRGQNGLCMADPIDNQTLLWCSWLPVKGEDPWKNVTKGETKVGTPYNAFIELIKSFYEYKNSFQGIDDVIELEETAQNCLEEFPIEEKFVFKTEKEYFSPCKEKLRALQNRLGKLQDSSSNSRRDAIILDISVSMAIGLEETRPSSFDDPILDQQDFREWLLYYGLRSENAYSPPLNSFYMTSFCYVNGDRSKPDFGAGIAMRSLYNAFITYRGHFGYYFKAGTGEVVFAPLYDLLVRRGVQFKFFHRIDSVNPSSDNQQVDSIDVSIQAQLLKETYYPYVTLQTTAGKMEAWPNQPNWDQLVNGSAMQAQGYNFESYYNTKYPVSHKKLIRGVDFDLVVLAISVGALPYVASNLIIANPNFSNSVSGIKTTPTFGVQLWFDESPIQLKVPEVVSPNEFSLANYEPPLDGLADFSHVLYGEDWTNFTIQPKSVIYLCQAWKPLPGPHPFNETDYPEKEYQHLVDATYRWMDQGNFQIIRGAVDRNDSLNYTDLVDPKPDFGRSRLLSQWFIAKVDPPTELYVLSAHKTLQYRLDSNESGFSNLFLAGDWTNNGVNYGCLEAAVSSAERAAKAIKEYVHSKFMG